MELAALCATTAVALNSAFTFGATASGTAISSTVCATLCATVSITTVQGEERFARVKVHCCMLLQMLSNKNLEY